MSASARKAKVVIAAELQELEELHAGLSQEALELRKAFDALKPQLEAAENAVKENAIISQRAIDRVSRCHGVEA